MNSTWYDDRKCDRKGVLDILLESQATGKAVRVDTYPSAGMFRKKLLHLSFSS